jgi:NitT/TauT family transport system permease protein
LQPFAAAQPPEVSLAPAALPNRALRTILRMLLALCVSFVFTFTYGTLAAKSRRAEMVLVPLLDVLQSVPVLGYLSFTVVFFVSLAPNRALGAELAAIFTSQAWNMAFSFHRCVPFHTISTKRAAAFAFPRGSVSDGLTYLLRCRA